MHGSWEQQALEDRLRRSFDSYPLPFKKLAARLRFQFEKPPIAIKVLAACLLDEPLLADYWQSANRPPQGNILLDSPVMGSKPDSLFTFPLPQLATTRDLAVWMGLFPWELRVLADCKGLQADNSEPGKHHYRYRWVNKRSGGQRLLEIPKSKLKQAQRLVLQHILNRVPPHECAHGFTKGRSCLSHVQPHTDKPVVLQMDLRDFFHSVSIRRVFGVFYTLGYPAEVARLLAGISTHAVSPSLVGHAFSGLSWAQKKILQDKHLPQGAPTSGALANLCAYRFDCRLQGVASRYGLQYSRYADDIAFSGTSALCRQASWIESLVGAIALEEGFQLNFRKTRLQTRSRRQLVTGIVVNAWPNLPRAEYDCLKAILYNCLRYGPASQNREDLPNFRDHLAGRVSRFKWINQHKGEKLEALLGKIEWDK